MRGLNKHFWHGPGHPLFDVVHPAFPLLNTVLPTLQSALQDGLGEAVMVCDMPEPCKFTSLDSCYLLEEAPVDPQGSWSCAAPTHWSCAPSRRCGEVASGTWSQKPITGVCKMFMYVVNIGWLKGGVTHCLTYLCGPYGLVKRVEEFEAEAVLLGGPFQQLACVQQYCAHPLTSLLHYNNPG